MIVIVPLAGPDMILDNNSLKCQWLFRGEPFIKYILDSRAWCSAVDRYIFIFHDHVVTRAFYSEYLKIVYPNSGAVFLTDYTNGAATSCLSALSLITDASDSIIIDFADIYFECVKSDFFDLLKDDAVNSAALTFKSDLDIYSYLKFNSNGIFEVSIEKKVISNCASAAVYYFDSVVRYIDALSWVVKNKEDYMHNDLFYVCPLLNGVNANGGNVRKLNVSNIWDPKLSKGNEAFYGNE